jgi:hypothetical protein
VQAGLPTVYQSRPDYLYFFSEDGVFETYCGSGVKATDLRRQIPESTWCLIDSNRSLMDVPTFITDLGRFIVQASSPRAGRVAWKDKSNRSVIQYYMKPWSLSEILAGYALTLALFVVFVTSTPPSRTLQARIHSEVDLKNFYLLYGPSARSAYTKAREPQSYDKALLEKISTITYEQLDKLIRSSMGLNMSDELSHQLVLIVPSTMRDTLEASIATYHLYGHVRDVLCHRRLEAANRLYLMFLRNPRTKACAGYMLDDAIHEFHKGGSWAIARMIRSNRAGPKYMHWKKPNVTGELEHLHIGYDGQLIAISANPSHRAAPEALELHFFEQGAALTLKDGYYCPTSHNQETLDAFLYEEASKRVTILQATVSPTHSVKVMGLLWLQGLGVKSFRYIAVTPPDTQLDLPFPNSLVSSVSDVYSLVLDSVLPV